MNLVESALVAIALLVGLGALRSRRELRAWIGADPLAMRRWLRALCLIAGAVLAGVALKLAAAAPPQLTGADADVVLLVDVSRSMDAQDTPPSRMRRAVRAAERLIEQARAVRMGLVVFAGEAFVVLPLTQDRDALLSYVRALDSDTVSVRGSDLERAFSAAARTFDPRSDRPRTLVLLSDGEDSGASIDTSIGRLKSLGIRVVAVGFGSLDGAVVPLAGGGNLEDDDGVIVRSRRDDTLLRRVAAGSDGRYFRDWEDRPDPLSLLPAPEHAQRSEPPAKRDPIDLLLGCAALVLLAELWISSRPRRLRFARFPRPAFALPLLALTLLAFGPAERLRDGDELLASDQAQEALTAYRQAERSYGPSPASRIRIGNAQYRLGRHDQASAAYLEALRLVRPEDDEARFAASFNLGNTLLVRQRFREAYDAFWTAVLSQPDSLEAKYNYEWAAQRIEEEPPLPDVPSNPQQPQQEADANSQQGDARAQGRDQRPAERQDAGLEQSEAERWMESLEENVSDTLQRQITRAQDGRTRREGQSW